MLLSRDGTTQPRPLNGGRGGPTTRVRITLGLAMLATMQVVQTTSAVGAARAPASYAYALNWGEGGMLLASFPATSTSTPSRGDATAEPVAAPAATAPETTPSETKSPLLQRETEVLTRQGISTARAEQAIDVQGKIAQTEIASKLEAGLAGGFAGVWFEPAAAQLHVGVTSTASRRTAEGIIAHAGLTGDVVTTTVRSTWEHLQEVQRQWNGRLADLFAREEAKTALAPQLDAVVLTLSSALPSPERLALERAASAADVRILVAVAPSSELHAVPQSKQTKCVKFEEDKANCEPSITAGVRIESNNIKPSSICTAGPLAIGTEAAKGNTYVLTAGHCIDEREGSWDAFNLAGTAKEIGQSGGFVFGKGPLCSSKCGDFGEIKVDNSFWKTSIANDPVYALTAEWKFKEEKSYPVKGERAPAVGNTDCHEGQTTGESCGQVKALEVTETVNGVMEEGLVEDKGAKSSVGDSGGPWMFIEANNEVRMEGTHVAEDDFEPVKTELNQLKLELLTTANEIRCP